MRLYSRVVRHVARVGEDNRHKTFDLQISSTMKPFRLRFLFLLVISFSLGRTEALTLTTKTSIKGVSVQKLQNFLATPTNWPVIVASSVGVESAASNKVDKPLIVGDRVREIFGLPPLIPLSVVWTCRQNDEDRLEFVSPEGLENFATDCRMCFQFSPETDTSATVTLSMEFQPVSPLAIAAIPILSLDNDLAIKILLPNALKRM